MTPLGCIAGIQFDEEAIVLFNELSKTGNPMGKHHGLAVFADRQGAQPDLGKAYYCYLSRGTKSNVAIASIKAEVDIEGIISLSPGLKSELAGLIMEKHPDALKAEISAAQIKSYENGIREKYKAENAALRAKVERLEAELSKLSDMHLMEMELVKADMEIGIDGTLLYDKHLKDGEYSVRLDRSRSKALLVRCDGGEYYCTSGCIDIKPLLEKHKSRNATCRHCDEMDGVLVVF